MRMNGARWQIAGFVAMATASCAVGAQASAAAPRASSQPPSSMFQCLAGSEVSPARLGTIRARGLGVSPQIIPNINSVEFGGEILNLQLRLTQI